ncbi:transaldolase [Methylobacterium sp. J-076]|uniref:transaldolase n=1 Tax=Methylobacterium sp. J-076 TaxID=2836655 RepID=UPI001FB994C3|nr:transaldolase [Methylobacterium sp. J-076]MCJ2012488.1 transaldolase [Methylobacterium sp. J-076]
MTDPLHDLAAAGVAIWLDDLSRPMIESGALAEAVERDGVIGITTNPTIFAKAIGAGEGYDGHVRDLALRGTAIGETVRLLTAWDVRTACDVLRPVYDRTGGRDGRVSIEVDPRISGDTERTVAEARGLWWLVDRPNLYIKIPATDAGLPAISTCLAEGISVNVTLIFSVARYEAVLDGFLTGLERRAAAGESLVGVESVASFFLSRVDIEVDRRLAEGAGNAVERDRVRGQAAIANARLAYGVWEDSVASARWHALKGARPQRLLWASTGVKDKALDDTRYVVELAGPETVNTMAQPTLRAVADHGRIRPDTIHAPAGAAQAILNELERLGIDMADVATTLEAKAVASFEASWNELIASVTGQLERAGAGVMPAEAVCPASGQDAPKGAPAAAAPVRSGNGART